jgi:outer membrane receptor for ferrienterochelin and colicin
MRMKLRFGILACIAAPLIAAFGQETEDPHPIFTLSLEELLAIRFYTASRYFEEQRSVPAVISVITREEIEKHGIKDLNELLKRTPGFFMENANWVQSFITHRGIRTDQNVGILVLVDGHPQNVNSAYGVDHMHLFPTLQKVERVEIVRGSSSTLWGSNAASAVINIITRDGAAMDPDRNPAGRFEVNLDYEFRDEQSTANVIWGKQFDDGDIMLSYTYMKSDGDPRSAYRPQRSGPPRAADNLWKPYAIIHDSQELYVKAHWKDFTLKTGYSDLVTGNGQNNSIAVAKDDSLSYRGTERIWLSLSHDAELTDLLSNEIRIYADQKTVQVKNRTNPRQIWFEEQGYGIENILRYTNEEWRGLLGFHYEGTEFRNDDREKAGAAFSEASYDITDRLTASAGGRFEKSDLRSDGTDFMPNASLVYGISELWTTRYAYSTGIVRPQRVYNVGDKGWVSTPDRGLVLGTHQPLESTTHEVQLVYTDDASHAGITLFHLDMNNLFIFIEQTLDGSPAFSPGAETVWYGNIDSGTSYGIEIEGQHHFNKSWRVYGNATYQYAKRDNDRLNADFPLPIVFTDSSNRFYDSDDRAVAVPTYLWNLGTDYTVARYTYLNLHYRGWADLRERYSETETRSKSPMHFVDLSLRRNNVSKNVDLGLSVKNVFDNKYEDVFLANSLGREIVLSVSSRF